MFVENEGEDSNQSVFIILQQFLPSIGNINESL